MSGFINYLYELKFYLQLRILLIKYKVPYKYVKVELRRFIKERPIYDIGFDDFKSGNSWLLFLVEYDFISEILKSKLVEKKKFDEKLNNIFDLDK